MGWACFFTPKAPLVAHPDVYGDTTFGNKAAAQKKMINGPALTKVSSNGKKRRHFLAKVLCHTSGTRYLQ